MCAAAVDAETPGPVVVATLNRPAQAISLDLRMRRDPLAAEAAAAHTTCTAGAQRSNAVLEKRPWVFL
jgi:hypothetical protein